MGAPTQGGGRKPPRPPGDDRYLAEMMRVSAMRQTLRTVAPSGPAGAGGGRVALKTVAPSGKRAANPERKEFFAEEQAHQAFMAKEEGLQRKHFVAEEERLQEQARRARKGKSKKKSSAKILTALQRRAG